MSTPSPTLSVPPASPVPRRRTMLYVLTAVVIVVVLIAAFVVLPTLTTSGSGGGPAVLTYRGAAAIANRTVAGFAGGGWTLLFAAGIVSPTNETYTANSTTLGNLTSYCTYTPVASVTNLTVPSFSGNRSSGESPAWELGYRNSTDALAIVSVLNGQGTVLAELSGLACSFYAQLLSPVPAGVLDSSQAAAAVEPEAASFLAAHPDSSAEFGVIGGASLFGKTVPAEWSIVYTTCAIGPSAKGTGDQFNATLNALTGKLLGSNTTTDAACGGSTTDAVGSPGIPVAPPPTPALARTTS